MNEKIAYVVNADSITKVFTQGLFFGIVIATSFFLMNRVAKQK